MFHTKHPGGVVIRWYHGGEVVGGRGGGVRSRLCACLTLSNLAAKLCLHRGERGKKTHTSAMTRGSVMHWEVSMNSAQENERSPECSTVCAPLSASSPHCKKHEKKPPPSVRLLGPRWCDARGSVRAKASFITVTRLVLLGQSPPPPTLKKHI